MSPHDPEPRSVVQNIVRLILRVGFSLILAWYLAGGVCGALLKLHLSAFDFVCGHNVYIQLPFLIISIYFLLGLFQPFQFRPQQGSEPHVQE